MRKTFVFVTILLFLGVFSVSAAPINVFGNVGIALDDLEGLFFDIGAERQLSGPWWAQVVVDYYLNPSGEDMPVGVNDSAYGGYLYGVYKYAMNPKTNFFIKGGFGYTTLKIAAMGLSVTESAFGLGAGAGFEYKIGPKMAILAGATYKSMFFEGETGTTFKLYGGFSYQVGQ